MSENKLSVLFLNCVEAQDSIYESGRMVYQCLQGSGKYSLDYHEITRDTTEIPGGYDVYLFNYHIVTMSWLDTAGLRKGLPGTKMTIVLEVSPNDPFVFCSPNDFDAYVVLDPTLDIDQSNAYAFPRPLEKFDAPADYEQKDVPVIGSFGFATEGKGFEHLVEAVNKEFDRAVVRINIPFASYADQSHEYAKYLSLMCKVAAKDGIEVVVTHDYMTKPELIEWCGKNTINCFLYDRNMPGLAATTDQAIASGRPLLVSQNDTFRHILAYLKPYPEISIKDAIASTGEIVADIRRDWAPERFRSRFEAMLDGLGVEGSPAKLDSAQQVTLPIINNKAPMTPRKLISGLAPVKRIKNLVRGNGFTR